MKNHCPDPIGQLRMIMSGLCLRKYDLLYLAKSEEWLCDPYTKKMTCADNLSHEQRLKWFEDVLLRKDYKIWGLEYDDVPIGVCGLKSITDIDGEYFGYIGEKDYRGIGIGKSMINQVIDKARQYGLSSIHLKVLHENIPAMSLYCKMGFLEYKSDETFSYMRMTI